MPMRKVRETMTRFTGIEPNQKIEFEAEIGADAAQV
jgi:hypothetical protein